MGAPEAAKNNFIVKPILAAFPTLAAYCQDHRNMVIFTSILLVLFVAFKTALTILAITFVFPLLWTLYLSVHDFSIAVGAPPPDFIGLENYIRIITSPSFGPVVLQTLGYVATTLSVELLIGMSIALLLQRETRTRKVMRAVVALPLMVAPVVSALAWKFLFSSGYGLINRGLELLGMPQPSWFSNPWLARITILVSNMWIALPFTILVLLAGLSTVPDELTEAARVDGAGRWATFRQITLPLLKPSLLIILTIRLADSFRVFDAVYVLTGGGPGDTTEVMSFLLYRLMFTRSDFSGASAAVILFVVLIGIVAGLIFIFLRERRSES